MNKLVICTVGTSIANQCPAQKEFFKHHNAWDSDAELLRSQIQDFLNKDEHGAKNPETRKYISAEINTLNRLGVERTDRIILLSSDNAQGRICSEMNKKVIMEAFGLSSAQVTIHRIEGLQVHNAKLFREKGLKNLVKIVVDEYLANESIRYNYDIIINPTGGFKAVVPFLTVLGMLYGKRTAYMFEFADELINLPPLPFSFDMALYDRVRPAISLIEAEVAVTEEAFLKKIKNYSPEERDRFLAFTEPFDADLITLSPLAYCLISIDKKQGKPLIAQSAAESLRKTEGTPALRIRQLVSNSVNPIWRERHVENWQGTDLLVLKQINTAERIAGFLKDGQFFITNVFASHDDYRRILGNYSKKDFINNVFVEWEETEDLGSDADTRDEALAERDRLLVEKNALKIELRNHEEKIEELELKNLDLSGKALELEKLRKVINEKEAELGRLRGEVNLIKKAAEATGKRTGFWGKLFSRIERCLGRKNHEN
jgi:putative CRISPR-associated protein (TIGR02619 family)